MNFLGSYTIKGVGKANVDKKILHCDFTISPTAFTAKFGQYMEDLPSEANIKLQQAVASKKDIKIDKDYADDLDVFLQKIKDVAEQETADTSMGFGAGEKEEEEEARRAERARRELPKRFNINQKVVHPLKLTLTIQKLVKKQVGFILRMAILLENSFRLH